MAVFDSIINNDEWISDHYLTTDDTKGESFGKRVAACVKEWKELDDSPLSRLTSNRQTLQKALATLDADSHSTVNSLIAETFGYGTPDGTTLDGAVAPLSFTGWRNHDGSLISLHAEQLDSIEELTSTTVEGEVRLGDKVLGRKDKQCTIGGLVSELFLSDTPPNFIVIVAAPWVILAERESWPLGRFLAINLALAIERNDTKSKGELQRVAASLARIHTERGADGTCWWQETIEESREHAVKVSEELRSAVKESIEIIGNDVLARHRAQSIEFDPSQGNELAKQSLRYLYRILFLLFAEASPELEILPTGTPEYDEGYGLARLRDAILTPPVTDKAKNGTHLYESLQLLFTLVNDGHRPGEADEEGVAGLKFRNLSADLFLPRATPFIDEVKLSNDALHQVLVNLLLTREKAGKDRGFISYATLGVTELGQVYEGLMSFTGFVAAEDLYEVAPHGDSSKGSWVLPVTKQDSVPADSFVLDTTEAAEGGQRSTRRRHAKGSFVFRQSSRDRERSASFYTPQVLTEFTVGQAIDVLKESGRIQTAEDVLTLTICEPAMGSGAFAVEAVRQLAELYLQLRQDELGEQIPAENRTKELQKVKAHIALHQVHGVDLNDTARELAEISLWLDTMTSGLQAPWFGLHLRRGNSLVGAMRATYSAKQVNDKSYLSAVPRQEPLTNLAAAVDAEQDVDANLAGRIHHFLLPAMGWGAAADAKDLKPIAPDELKALNSWRKSMRVKPSKSQLKQLQNLAYRVERLWTFALQRLRIAEEQSRRDIKIWGRDVQPTATNVQREQIESDLFNNEAGAYRRLQLVMDAWNTLWFWPVSELQKVDGDVTTALPNLNEWIATLQDILGIDTDAKAKTKGQMAFGKATMWDELNTQEEADLGFSGAKSINRVYSDHPWLNTVREVRDAQAFFHWHLEFANVFARGGFDFQIGNPPWVRPDVNFDELLAELDPWFKLAHKPSQAAKKERTELLSHSGEIRSVTGAVSETIATSAVLGSLSLYPHLKDQRPDLYRGFIEQTWKHSSGQGVISLIHPRSHMTERKAALLRRESFLRLRRYWHMTNKLGLFDIDANEKSFDVAVYASANSKPHFLMCGTAHHPHTIRDSLTHDGSGPVPAFKDDAGNWDRRPHADRIITVDESELKVWHSILEDETVPLWESRMVYTVNTEAAAVLRKLSQASRMKDYSLSFSLGMDETAGKKLGLFDLEWSRPTSWDDVIFQGPHIGIATPFIKEPNSTMKHNQDWSDIDLEDMASDFIPATSFKRNHDNPLFDSRYTHHDVDGLSIPDRSRFRFAWRRMAALTGERTLYSSVFPPGASASGAAITGMSLRSNHQTLLAGAQLSSFLLDFVIRATGRANIYAFNIEALPAVPTNSRSELTNQLVERFLELNSLTSAYAPLWNEMKGENWTTQSPIRRAEGRRKAQVEIDAMVALSLGVTADELCMIYRTQFPVMRRYDQEERFDANGRKVPKDVMKLQNKLKDGEELTVEQRTWTHPQSQVEYVFEYPFRQLDREADLRAAYAKYEKILADEGR